MPNLRNVKSQVTIVIFIVALIAFVACSASGSNGSAPPIAPEPTVSVARVAFTVTEPTRIADRAESIEDAAPQPGATSQEATPAATVELAPTATPVPTPSPEAVPEATPEPVAEPVAEIVEAPTPAPGAMEPPEPTTVPTMVPTPTPAPEIDVAVEPAAEQASEPGPAATLVETVDEFGFVLKLDRGADVRTTGWTDTEPSLEQGTLSFTKDGVNTVLIWGPQQERAPVSFLADTYNILKGSQPELAFDPISDGEITVSRETGVYGGFKTLDLNGATVGGGLIGAWVCSGVETAFRLTLTGTEATLVQLRFDRLVDQFACAS